MLSNVYKIHICYEGTIDVTANTEEEALKKVREMSCDTMYLHSDGTWDIDDSANEADEPDEYEEVPAIITTIWDDGTTTDAPCLVNLITHEVYGIEETDEGKIKSESYGADDEYLMIEDEMYAIVSYDEYCEKTINEGESDNLFWCDT